MHRVRGLLFVLVFTLLSPVVSFAAPVISGATTSSVSGSGFSSNSAIGTSSLQYIGDNIEDGTNGAVFSETGWGVYVSTESDTEAVPRYSQAQAHSGSQSIVIDYTKDGVTRYKGHFYRDHGSAISRLYLSFWVWAEGTGSGTNQWKIWRIKENTSFTDGSLDFIQTAWPDGARIAQLMTTVGQSDWDCDGCEYDRPLQGVYLGATEVPGPGAITSRWVRMEYWIDVGTIDTYDGTFFYKLHDPNNPTTPVIKDIPKLSFDESLMILKTGDAVDWRALLFGGAAVDGMDILTYWDDVFIQVGSWARVEIGNASTWAACTHREVQLPTSWGATSISYTLNQGSLPNGSAYIYVVDDNGDVNSSGELITLGATGALQAGTGIAQAGTGAFE